MTFHLLLAVLLSMESCSPPAPIPIRKAEVGITIGKKVFTKGVDLFLLMDESGSLYGEQGADPHGLRHEAGKYLVQNLLVKESDPAFPHRISVIHFGDVAVSRPFIDLLPANAGELAERLRPAGGHMGDTSFIEALREVQKVSAAAPAYKNPREPIVVVFTDGEPDDKRHLGLPQYFREIAELRHRRLTGFKFYVIGIDKTPDRVKWARSREFWEQEVGKENVFFITEMQELYARYNEVVRRIFEIPEVSPDVVLEEVAFEVQPYLDRLEFHLFPESKELKLGILRPDRTPVKADDRGVSLRKGEGYEILTLEEPAPGSWTYRIIEGKGRILVLRNPIPFKLALSEPPEVHPLGKPMLLKARFTRSEGKEIAEHPDYPLAFTAKVTGPDKKESNLQFLKDSKVGDVYYADKPISIQEPGKYRIRLTVKGGARFETASTREVFVHSYPYLEVIRPAALQSYPLSDDVPVEVALKRDGSPTEPEKEFESHPNALILAQLKASPYGTESPAVWLTRGGEKATFRGVIPHPLRKARRYSIAFQLAGSPRMSDRLRPPVTIEQVDFLIRPSAWQKARRWAGHLVAGLGIATLLWAAAFVMWLIRSPKTMANIEVLQGDHVVFTRYLNGGHLRPTRIAGEAGRPLVLWVRARAADTLQVTRGGLFSFFTFGLFGRRLRVRRNEETDLDSTRRIIFR